MFKVMHWKFSETKYPKSVEKKHNIITALISKLSLLSMSRNSNTPIFV